MIDRHLLATELARDEGKRLESYLDSLSYWTIGIGHLLGRSRRMLEITEAECSALFDHDVFVAERIAQRVVPGYDALDDVRQRALVNMAFNLGPKLGDFKATLAAIAAKDWEEAARRMADSRWARQVGARALRLQEMIRTGTVA